MTLDTSFILCDLCSPLCNRMGAGTQSLILKEIHPLTSLSIIHTLFTMLPGTPRNPENNCEVNSVSQI